MNASRGLLALSLLAGGAWAQQPVACGDHPDLQVICGVKATEDLELTPDGRYLIATQYFSNRHQGDRADLLLMELATRKFASLAVAVEPLNGWGDPSCKAPAGLASHGSSLTRRNGGLWQLFVVNHYDGRESIEMYELKKAGNGWTLSWHGCATSEIDYNDVAALADGSFIGTHPSALRRNVTVPAVPGQTGWVAKWTAAAGETEVPGTRLNLPNGVVASPDGRYYYIAGFGSHDVLKYDVKAGKVIASAPVGFMPDNLTWTANGHLIAAGIKDLRGNCPPEGNIPCRGAFGVARVDPRRMQSTALFDSKDRALASGVSVAIEAGSDLYVGAFEGDRVVRIPNKTLGRQR